jgi:carbon storage regulator CsrA
MSPAAQETRSRCVAQGEAVATTEVPRKEKAMLVLTRKRGQAVYVSSEICITVCRVQGKRVKIGIQAPAGVRISRESQVLGPLMNANELRSISVQTP